MNSSKSHLKHISIIMDGNGRWAKNRSHKRTWGHIRGASVATEIVEEACDLNLESLTLYAFSNENWSRSENEIKFLIKLLNKFIIKEESRIINNSIRFRVIGEVSPLPIDIQKRIISLEEKTKLNKGLRLTFAFSYGGRQEIVNAVNKFISTNPGKSITEKGLAKYLYNPDVDEIDLLIRTGGDQRISNFLLWQISYAELCFVKEKWPDFSREQFRGIIKKYSSIERKFGHNKVLDSLKESLNIAHRNKVAIKESMETL